MRWELTLHPCSSMKRGYAVVHEAMWQRPAKCEKVNFLYRASPIFTLRLPRLHMLVFLLMLPVIAKHPHLISSIFHSFWVESISCLHLISLRFPLLLFFFSPIWLSPVHFLPRLPAPDSVGSASAGSGQVEVRRGGVEPLMCYQWQVAVVTAEDCQYLLLV